MEVCVFFSSRRRHTRSSTVSLGSEMCIRDRHWAEAKAMVSAIKPCITTFDNASFADILQAGEVAVSHGFSGEFAKAIEENPDLTYIVPKEGTTIWVDNMAVPADAPSQVTAEIFINFLLRPDIGARLTNYTYYALSLIHI